MNSASQATEFEVSFRGIKLKLISDSRLFSPRGPDLGTLAMLQQVTLEPDDRVLDLGCGCGIVGICIARLIGESQVVLSDVDPVAVEVARRNSTACGLPNLCVHCSDGFRDLDHKDFTKILCNPPYHTDFSVAKHFILKGFNRLAIGGEMILVTKRDAWYRRKMTAVFGGHQCEQIDGYFVIRATRRRLQYASRNA